MTPTTTTPTLTEKEIALLQLYREMDERGKHHLFLAARSIKTTAEEAKRIRW